MSAVLPVLVPKRDMPGAVSLQSVQLNLSRVIGPAIGGLLLPLVEAWGIFAINAATYGFAIFVIARAALPRVRPADSAHPGSSGVQRLLGGLSVARRTRSSATSWSRCSASRSSACPSSG